MSRNWKEEFKGLPGGDLIQDGLDDLEEGKISESALLVLVARPRLLALGIPVKVPENLPAGPVEHALYSAIEERLGRGAHSYYNSLIRRAVSFEHALEREETQELLKSK
jgi:hypothetical protein